MTEQVGWGESMEYRDVTTPADAPTHFTAQMSVGEDGSVNGKKLMADIAVAVTSATATVDNEFKDQTLKEAGLSDEWMQNASEAQKAYALAKIIEAKATPGTKTLDLSYPYSYTQMSGEDSQQVNTTAAGVLTLKVDEQGLVNGKPLTIEAALNATRTVEQMPNAVRRATLRSLGFDSEPIRNASADQTKYALVKASMATRTPGTTQFEVHMGGDKYAVGMKIGENGEILGAGTAKIPPPPKKSWWKSVVSVVCTVVSICYPPAAIICSGIQSAIAIGSGRAGWG